MILILDSDTATQHFYRRMLYSHGILTLAMSYQEFLNTGITKETLALLISNPYDRLMPYGFARACHLRYPNIPIIMICPPLKEKPAEFDQANIVISSDTFTPREFTSLLLEISRFHKRDVAELRYEGAYDHLLQPAPQWYGTPFYLTPVERAIFRYLIKAENRPVTAKELLRHCMKPGTAPALSVISTHIYQINRKAQEELHTHVIHCPGNLGYTILTYQ